MSKRKPAAEAFDDLDRAWAAFLTALGKTLLDDLDLLIVLWTLALVVVLAAGG